MSALFSGEEIIEITGGRMALGNMPDDAGEICTDTRTLKEGQWFMALPGRKYNGHDFLGDAYSQGAIGCIVEERVSYPIASTSFPLIAVNDPFEAMSKLARNWRRRINPKVLLVTANPSEGERAAAAMCFRVLSASMRSVKLSAAGMSSELVLNAILSIPDDTEAVVLEASPLLLVESPYLVDAAQPHVVVLTKGGWDHLRLTSVEAQIIEFQLQFLRTIDGKKCTVVISTTSQDLKSMIPNAFAGTLIMFGEEQECAELEAAIARPEFNALVAAPDSWAAVAACHDLGLDYETITKRLERA